jgi:hypothetical protein
MFDILTIIPGKKKLTQSGWHSFNAPCCHNRGHKSDKRMRGGIKTDGTNWSFHCFNCNFKCGFTLGKQFTKNTKQFLQWCGVDENQINRWNLESLQNKDLIDYVKLRKKKTKIKFEEIPLPDNMEMICPDNPKHEIYVSYLNKRGIGIYDYPFLVTPDEEGRNANRIIIPFTYENKIVGHTSRFLDDRKPKFISQQQSGFLFGYDIQKPKWQVCLVFEGILDAISLNGCALTTNSISETQAEILRKLQRKVIVVPDQDKSGLEICDQALEMGFHVSIPEWGEGVKDANDAIVKYGRLPTLLSILQSSTNSKIKIQIARTKLDKRL